MAIQRKQVYQYFKGSFFLAFSMQFSTKMKKNKVIHLNFSFILSKSYLRRTCQILRRWIS